MNTQDQGNETPIEAKPRLVIVTGLSGAGKTIAINALEDLGFYCIDNLPLELIDQAIEFFLNSAPANANGKFALGMDTRHERFVAEFPRIAGRVEEKLNTDILFLNCDDEQLAERFGTTRRKHPLLDQGGELLAAIRREKNELSPIEAISDVVMDTSGWSPHALKRQIEENFASDKLGRQLYVTVTSFGFKHGLLKPCDSVFDVRFLKNPHFDLALREKTGLEKRVKDYIFSDKRAQSFLDQLLNLHTFLLPQYFLEGKHYFRIGIGCTGGKHRSVAIAEALGLALAKSAIPKVYVSVNHRDLDVGL